MSVTSTTTAVESSFITSMSKAATIGSTLEFATACAIGRSSSATLE
jgi:hypothetical protein